MLGAQMAGRKRRQNIKRQPNGQPSRDRGIDPKLVAASQPHRQGIPLSVIHDPAAETNFGRLMLLKHISPIEYQAGVNWRGIVGRYRAIIGVPSQNPASMSGVIVGPWGGGDELTPEQIGRRRDEYHDAYNALSKSGNRQTRAVNHWAIYDRGDYAIEYLVCGLDALAVHFGLTRRPNQLNAINRN
jgi:hypothetical protein